MRVCVCWERESQRVCFVCVSVRVCERERIVPPKKSEMKLFL